MIWMMWRRERRSMNTQNLVLAQFEKVKRTKSKWKCTLKDGIMHMNNRDILFNKATGDFDF
ncbi:putative transcription factor IIA, alpha/beta subunit [Rosa chinensis]|uniref:Putative transcription factor IIA, alpha/beta subunit n=1 Tax=Rosa chinensis TaxID=74649 RepID=A0A2P6Q9S0_ROSCH|nr:putative transcription factor IIA, alpha/beta subunit [Rosa chinensis]